MKKLLTAILAGTLLAFAAVAVASAGPPNAGTTSVPSSIASGTDGDVNVTVTGKTPVVAYEYTLVNQCTFPLRPWGHYTSTEKQSIVYWAGTSDPNTSTV